VDLDTNGLATSLDPGVLDLNGTNQTIAGLLNATRATMPRVMNSAAGSMSTFTINNSNNYSYSGTIIDGAGTVAIAKTGVGIQTFSAANSYSGGTTVSGGTLTLANVLAAGSGAMTVTNSRAVYTAGLPSA